MDKKITDSIIYIGVDDKDIDLFESQYVVPNGVSYNSYVIMDDKIAIMDTADARVTDKWFANLREALGDRKPDYLVVSHLEPDHASNIQKVAEAYPDMQIVGNAKTFNMMGQFFDIDLTDRKVVVAEGDKLSLGKHELTFVMAPMVHSDKVSATAGKFFTLTMQLKTELNVIGFYHNDAALTKVASAEAVYAANDTYYYDATTGVLTYSTDDFSPFTVVVSDSEFNGGKGTKDAPYLIATGEQAYGMRDAKGYFKFVNDVVVTKEIYLSGKTYTVDLNGHSVKLEYADDVKPNNGGVFNIAGKKSSLTINDSSEAQTGAVIGSDKTYSNKVTSAVRVGNYGKLTINGGHFYGKSKETSCIFVATSRSSGSKATVTINGGIFETANPLNGTYYVLNHQDSNTTGCTITVNGGQFKNYNPGVTVVDPENPYTGKVDKGTGCKTTERVDGNDTWYIVSK